MSLRSCLALCVAMLLPLAAQADLTSYSQNFESLPDPAGATALSDDGWLVGANVFDSSGGFLYNYFAFPAPNGGPAFSAVATGAAGPAQGTYYMNTYNDYNNGDHSNGSNNVIEANIFREMGLIGAGDLNSVWNFDFQFAVGDPGPAQDAFAFVKVLKTSDSSFATLYNENFDTAGATATWVDGQLSLNIDDASWIGETVQIGFVNTASNFSGSGVYYDNLNFASAVPEPSSALIVGFAAVGIAMRRRRK